MRGSSSSFTSLAKSCLRLVLTQSHVWPGSKCIDSQLAWSVFQVKYGPTARNYLPYFTYLLCVWTEVLSLTKPLPLATKWIKCSIK